MNPRNYVMESKNETHRLEIKTDFQRLEEQALWAGLKKGMRVLDVGCGSGITSSHLYSITGDTGHVTGIDCSEDRISHAAEKYGCAGIEFIQKDIYTSLSDLGTFDFIWVRFFLEYHKTKSFEIVKKLSHLLNSGGILCLVDLDNNSLNHYELSDRFEKALQGVMKTLEEKKDFDPYAGRKLYSYLYDLNLINIEIMFSPHHLIYGTLSEADAYNWEQKIAIAGKNSGYGFKEYPNGYDDFFKEFKSFFRNPRRFTYTPLIACRGVKS